MGAAKSVLKKCSDCCCTSEHHDHDDDASVAAAATSLILSSCCKLVSRSRGGRGREVIKGVKLILVSLI